MHRSGFVNIIGNPNVGKSTLMNALVGEKLSIITSKEQTTRHRIMGIVSGDDFQIVYSDTPGILKPSYKLQESMMKFVTGALTDADVILYVTDTVEQSERSAEIVERSAGAAFRPSWSSTRSTSRRPKRSKRWWPNGRPNCPAPGSYPYRPARSSTSRGCSEPSSRCFPKARRSTPRIRSRTRPCASSPRRSSARRSSTSTTRRSPTAAKSRSKATGRSPTIDRIAATIYVARDSQKGILIGHKGEKLKRVGQTAREDMEQFLGKKVFLQLFVKVSDDWRNNERQLRRFGYEQE